MKILKYIFLFCFFLMGKPEFAQPLTQRHCAGTVTVGNWDRSVPLADFLSRVHSSGTLIMIGSSRKSVFSYEITASPNQNDKLKQAVIVETDTNGHRNTWSAKEVFGHELFEQNHSDSISKNVQSPIQSLLEKSTPVELWICPSNYDWVAKVNSKNLKKCFTWFYVGASCNEPSNEHLASFKVTITPYATSRELGIYESVFTVPLPCHIDTISSTRLNVITGKDTISFIRKNLVRTTDSIPIIARNYDSLSSVPFSWLQTLSLKDPNMAKVTNFQMAHPDSSLKAKFPLLKTHQAELVTNTSWSAEQNENETEWIIVLKPLQSKSGKIYVLQAYDCYKGVDYVIVETSAATVAGQKRYTKIFKTMKAR